MPQLPYHVGVARATKSRTAVLVCLLAAIATAGYVTYRHRFRIRALVWHVLHGDSAAVGGYRIKVPRHWFVEQRSSDDAQLWNTKTAESIWLHSSRKSPNFSLEFWSDLQKRMSRPENPIVGRRDLRAGGESFVCLERDFAVKTIHLPSVDCESAGPLEIMFFGGARTAPRHDYPEFYSLMASIQKN